MDLGTFKSVVDLARYAPSAHNSQPARWSLLADGTILVSLDLLRRLPVGDPDDRDSMIAAGTAVEGTVLSLAHHGQGAQVDLLSRPDENGLRPVAAISPTGAPIPEHTALATQIRKRVTHRKGFIQKPNAISLKLANSCLISIEDPNDVRWLSTLIDHASARIMKDASFRKELVDWMRLSSRHPYYLKDGLNDQALAMDALTAKLTRPILTSWIYQFLGACGLGPALSGEATRSQTSTAILLFHWPDDGSMIDAGRFFYRTWLHLTSLGYAGWPAAALADDCEASGAIADRFGIPGDHRLFNSLRVGVAKGELTTNTRLTTEEVIV